MNKTVQVIAPAGAGAMNINLPSGGVHIAIPGPTGLTTVPEEALDVVTRLGWTIAPPEPMTDKDLGALRRRRDELVKRRNGLRDQLLELGQEKEALAAKLEGRRAELAAGKVAPADVATARRDLVASEETIEEGRTALASIEAELSAVEHDVQHEEAVREKARQETAAGALLEEAAQCKEAFLRGVLGLREPLRRLHAIAWEIEKDFPAVAAPAALTIEELGAELAKRWEDFGSDSGKHATYTDRFRGFLFRTIVGPMAEQEQVNEVLRSCHVAKN